MIFAQKKSPNANPTNRPPFTYDSNCRCADVDCYPLQHSSQAGVPKRNNFVKFRYAEADKIVYDE